ncbi:MAG: hypothetical protein WCZ90_04755 [Melioribacteraceae bacterium]
MKKTIALFVFISTLCLAQVAADTIASTPVDSIDLHAIVEKQIAAARERALNEKLYPKPVVAETKKEIVVAKTVKKEINATKQATANPFITFILAQPWQYTLFALVSFSIIGFVLARRVIVSFTRSSKKALKQKIGMMREEKVGGSKLDPKLTKARRVLKDNLDIFKQADKQIDKKAKQLNLAKGELLLAARLKLYEVGKM